MALAFVVWELRLSAFGSHITNTEKQAEPLGTPGGRNAIVPDVDFEGCILGGCRYSLFIGPDFADRSHSIPRNVAAPSLRNDF